MKPRNGQNGLRLEQALEFLPPVDPLASLRSLLYSTTRENLRAGRDGTIGKRSVLLERLRELGMRAAETESERAGRLCNAAVDALESFQRGDRARRG